jgi:hypothetical protein
MEEELRLAEELLRQEGVSAAEREAELARLSTALTAAYDFDEVKRQAAAALQELDNARSAIAAKAAAGLMGQLQAETQLLALEEDRLDVLGDLAAQLLAAAEATGNPDNIQHAREFAAAIDEIAYNVEAATDAFLGYGEAALESATSSLATFFDTGIDGSKSFAEAFRNLALSIIADLKRIGAQMLANRFIDWLGSFGGSSSKSTTPKPRSSGYVPSEWVAGGGLIQGPGTGTSDSILAAISAGEYVVRAASVAQPGVLEHLRTINTQGARAIPRGLSVRPVRFAEGGLVAGGGAGTDRVEGDIRLGLEAGLIVRELDTPAGQKVMIRTVGRNRRAFRSALGI